MSNIILNRKFICSESDFGTQGHNKFWNCNVDDTGVLNIEYGRVGDCPQKTKKHFLLLILL
jgi:predicted DNA-binding WGR domain protein